LLNLNLIARFKIGHTPRKNRLTVATSRFFAYLSQSRKVYYTRFNGLFQGFYTIISLEVYKYFKDVFVYYAQRLYFYCT